MLLLYALFSLISTRRIMFDTNPIFDNLNKIVCKGSIRTMEINDRISQRNIPSQPLQPRFSTRPVQTKYTLFPTHDIYPKATIPIIKQPTYNVEKVFNPGNAQAPWSGFATNINTESKLRNQFFALQKSEQSIYIPSSGSELYNARVPENKKNNSSPFNNLTKVDLFCDHNPNTHNIATNSFHNCTRQQLKDVIIS